MIYNIYNVYNNEENRINRGDIPQLESGEKIKLDFDFENVNIKKRRKFPFFLLLLLILLAVSGIFIFKKSQEKIADFEPDKNAVNVSAQNEDSSWHGAFSSKEIFEACRKSTVLIIAGGKRCSGFVYSSDGWIATLESVVNDNVKGQIEVYLFDGTRYFVEAFRQNRQSGITLMKINATKLKAVNTSGKGEISAGEELFSFCFVGNAADGGSLFSGKVSHTNRTVDVYRTDGTCRELEVFQIGILLADEGVGAPIFNANGELVGIACAGGENTEEPFMVNYAIPFYNVKNIFSTMKNGKNEDNYEFY